MLSNRERSGAGSLATSSAIRRDDYPATKVIEEPFCAGLGPEKRHKADAAKCASFTSRSKADRKAAKISGIVASCICRTTRSCVPERRTSAALPPRVHGVVRLTLLRRPAIGLGAGAAHQHRPLAVAQAVGLEEGRDALLVVDDGEGASPVRAP
jgi:hypothetical protein